MIGQCDCFKCPLLRAVIGVSMSSPHADELNANPSVCVYVYIHVLLHSFTTYLTNSISISSLSPYHVAAIHTSKHSSLTVSTLCAIPSTARSRMPLAPLACAGEPPRCCEHHCLVGYEVNVCRLLAACCPYCSCYWSCDCHVTVT